VTPFDTEARVKAMIGERQGRARGDDPLSTSLASPHEQRDQPGQTAPVDQTHAKNPVLLRG
jgi:hypothetical protein